MREPALRSTRSLRCWAQAEWGKFTGPAIPVLAAKLLSRFSREIYPPTLIDFFALSKKPAPLSPAWKHWLPLLTKILSQSPPPTLKCPPRFAGYWSVAWKKIRRTAMHPRMILREMCRVSVIIFLKLAVPQRPSPRFLLRLSQNGSFAIFWMPWGWP